MRRYFPKTFLMKESSLGSDSPKDLASSFKSSFCFSLKRAGTSTRILTSWSPRPRQASQGFSTTLPSPWQRGQVWEREKNPWRKWTVPAPRHCGQVLAEDPGLAPDPEHFWQVLLWLILMVF